MPYHQLDYMQATVAPHHITQPHNNPVMYRECYNGHPALHDQQALLQNRHTAVNYSVFERYWVQTMAYFLPGPSTPSLPPLFDPPPEDPRHSPGHKLRCRQWGNGKHRVPFTQDLLVEACQGPHDLIGCVTPSQQVVDADSHTDDIVGALFQVDG